jgi:putative transposase
MEILVLRHELAILRRQSSRPRPTRADRPLLASLSGSLARPAWAVFPIKPETLVRWHRQLIARRWTCSRRTPGRPPLERSLRKLILRLPEQNPHWGYRRIVGELKGLGIGVGDVGAQGAARGRSRAGPAAIELVVASLLRAQPSSTLARDFLTVETAFGRRIYLLFFISLATRRIEYVGRVAQQARNLIMRVGAEQPFRFLTHDRDPRFSPAFDEVFRTAGIRVIRTPVRAPNANAHAERWVGTVRADCLDRRSSSSVAAISSTCSASTVATTAGTGHTARCTSNRRTAATQRR